MSARKPLSPWHQQRQREHRRRFYQRAMDRLRSAFGGICGECGIAHGAIRHLQNGNSLVVVLEFAHVAKTGLKGRGRGRADRVHDIKRNPEAYRLLCRECHMGIDYGGVDPWAPRPAAELEAVPF